MTVRLEGNYFTRDGQPFWPIGFNHWPSSTSVHCWAQFNLSEWEEDFRLMRARGYNTARIFLIWETFQPEEDRIDLAMLDKLRQVCRAGAEAGLELIPTIFQGWMSGVNFDPPWRRGRNHIRDLSLRPAMVRLCEAVAGAVREFDNILAIDLANEINVICQDVDFASIESWTGELGEAIRRARPGTLVLNGDAVPSAMAKSQWSFAPQKVDVQSMHGYPVFWTPLPLGRLIDVRSSLVFGYMTAFAHAFGPVMREEFGTAVGGDGAIFGHFMRANCAATWLAGANGFLYWCWCDFAWKELPYRSHPYEATLGYLTTEAQPKEWGAGYDAFRDFLQQYADYRPAPAEAAIYLTNSFKKMGDHGDVAMATAYEMLALNGITPKITDAIPNDVRLLVVPCAMLEIDEIEALHAFAENGGCVIACEIHFRTASHYWERFTGFRQEDMLRYAGSRTVQWDGEAIVCDPMQENAPSAVFCARRPEARVLAWEDDMPRVTATQIGRGAVVQFVLPLADSHEREVNPSRVRVWKKLIEATGFAQSITLTPNTCQAGIMENAAGDKKVLVINHGREKTMARISALGQTWEIEIGGKDFAICDPSQNKAAEGARDAAGVRLM